MCGFWGPLSSRARRQYSGTSGLLHPGASAEGHLLLQFVALQVRNIENYADKWWTCDDFAWECKGPGPPWTIAVSRSSFTACKREGLVQCGHLFGMVWSHAWIAWSFCQVLVWQRGSVDRINVYSPTGGSTYYQLGEDPNHPLASFGHLLICRISFIDDALFGQQAISEALVRWHPAARLSWVGLKTRMTTEHSPQLPLWKMTLSLVEPCRLKWPSILDRAWCFDIDQCRYVHVALACFGVVPVGRCEKSRWTKTSPGKITQSIHTKLLR